jgi:hypothetical protein
MREGYKLKPRLSLSAEGAVALMFSLLAEVLVPSPREYTTHCKLRRLEQANVRKGRIGNTC